jgi:hypothetical protein
VNAPTLSDWLSRIAYSDRLGWREIVMEAATEMGQAGAPPDVVVTLVRAADGFHQRAGLTAEVLAEARRAFSRPLLQPSAAHRAHHERMPC